jgi:aerobic-type carbon monoxide dehydrogenase small subunit (CoxS/CutS family)
MESSNSSRSIRALTLLDLLREKLQLTGTKKGCDHGQCGACTVLANGRRINRCLSLAVIHEGDQITTVEGLERPLRMQSSTPPESACVICQSRREKLI